MVKLKKPPRDFYKGMKMNQASGTMKVFKSFLKNEKFDTLIELGTGRGTLTLFLSDITGSKIYTFSKGDAFLTDSLRAVGVSVVKADVFSDSTIEQIQKLISAPGRVLMLCDNGDKVKEFNTFSQFLKQGDVIMAHDYFKNKKARNQSVWRGCEITEADVKVSAKKYNLAPFYQDEFDKIVWMIKIRR